MPAGHAQSGPGTIAGKKELGTASLLMAHLILHGWTRRITGQVLLHLE